MNEGPCCPKGRPRGVVTILRNRTRVTASQQRRWIAALVALFLIPQLLWTVASQAAPIKPTAINVAAATDNTGLGGAVPTVLVAADVPFALTVNLFPAGAAFNRDTTLDLTATLDPSVGGSPHGVFSPATITMPAGVSSQVFSISYTAADNGVVLTASVAVPKGKVSDVASGVTEPFDVLSDLLSLSKGNPQFSTGVGVGDAQCTAATTEPQCGIVVLPNDIESAKAALSLGTCTPNLGCTRGSQVVQFIADLGSRYTPQAPATLIFRCSKSLCRATNNGVEGFTLKVSQSATGPLDRVSQPCIAKGIADNGLNNGDTFCTDYVQSRRSEGDLLLYLLFTEDMRGST